MSEAFAGEGRPDIEGMESAVGRWKPSWGGPVAWVPRLLRWVRELERRLEEAEMAKRGHGQGAGESAPAGTLGLREYETSGQLQQRPVATPTLRLRVVRSSDPRTPYLLSLRLEEQAPGESATDMKRALARAGFEPGDVVVLQLERGVRKT